MIRGLFARLTGGPRRGTELFQWAVDEARRPHWFTIGQVPDTVEGRFAVLATVMAMLIVRLEQGGPTGEAASVALTERAVDSFDSDLRQMGVGDPALGKQVRGLLGALALRVERWRGLLGEGGDWTPIVKRSVYRDEPVPEAALEHSESSLRDLWRRLEATDHQALIEGKIE